MAALQISAPISAWRCLRLRSLAKAGALAGLGLLIRRTSLLRVTWSSGRTFSGCDWWAGRGRLRSSLTRESRGCVARFAALGVGVPPGDGQGDICDGQRIVGEVPGVVATARSRRMRWGRSGSGDLARRSWACSSGVGPRHLPVRAWGCASWGGGVPVYAGGASSDRADRAHGSRPWTGGHGVGHGWHERVVRACGRGISLRATAPGICCW